MQQIRSSVTIRPATAEDVPAILAIYNEAGVGTTASADYEPHTLDQRAEWLAEHDRDGYPVLVADDGGEVVGWASLSAYHRRIGYRFTAEDSVYIALARCGEGIGKLLLEALIQAGSTAGFHTIVATIGGTNEASIRLHARFGFQHAGALREAIHKFGKWQDVTYMQLVLQEADNE